MTISSARVFRLSALIFALAVSGSSLAQAQSYPSKPVRLIVPLAAGSAADGVARAVTTTASKYLGQQIVIENEGGAAAIPGATRASKAAPDGYTILLGSGSIMATNPHIFNNLPYNPEKDFAAIARLGSQALIMAVPATSPVKTVKDFVDLAKQGKVDKYASLGPGTPAHLSGESLKKSAGIELKHIPFPPGPQSVLALGRGELDMMFYGLPSFQPALQAGTIRLVGIAAEKRSSFLPDLPTMREQGHDVVITAWYGIYAPAGTPKEAIDRLADAYNKAMADPDVIKALQNAGTDDYPSKSPEEFDAFTKSEITRYKGIIDAAGVPKT
jgi:tripartite-type tricarboxylate transporter receptor subunit TctC